MDKKELYDALADIRGEIDRVVNSLGEIPDTKFEDLPDHFTKLERDAGDAVKRCDDMEKIIDNIEEED